MYISNLKSPLFLYVSCSVPSSSFAPPSSSSHSYYPPAFSASSSSSVTPASSGQCSAVDPPNYSTDSDCVGPIERVGRRTGLGSQGGKASRSQKAVYRVPLLKICDKLLDRDHPDNGPIKDRGTFKAYHALQVQYLAFKAGSTRQNIPAADVAVVERILELRPWDFGNWRSTSNIARCRYVIDTFRAENRMYNKVCTEDCLLGLIKLHIEACKSFKGKVGQAAAQHSSLTLAQASRVQSRAHCRTQRQRRVRTSCGNNDIDYEWITIICYCTNLVSHLCCLVSFLFFASDSSTAQQVHGQFGIAQNIVGR